MSWRKKILITFSVLFSTIFIIVLLFVFGVLKTSMFGTFTLSKNSELEFTVDQPILNVLISLTASGVQQKMMERLDVKILESKKLRNDIPSAAQLWAGKWSADIEEEMLVELNDPVMGKMVFTLLTTTKAKPGEIRIETALAQPTETLKRFQQTVTLTPVVEEKPKNPEPAEVAGEEKKPAEKSEKSGGGSWISALRKPLAAAAEAKTSGNENSKTKFRIEYASDVVIPFPEFSFIRAEAERRLTQKHEEVLKIMETVFTDSCAAAG